MSHVHVWQRVGLCRPIAHDVETWDCEAVGLVIIDVCLLKANDVNVMDLCQWLYDVTFCCWQPLDVELPGAQSRTYSLKAQVGVIGGVLPGSLTLKLSMVGAIDHKFCLRLWYGLQWLHRIRQTIPQYSVIVWNQVAGQIRLRSVVSSGTLNSANSLTHSLIPCSKHHFLYRIKHLLPVPTACHSVICRIRLSYYYCCMSNAVSARARVSVCVSVTLSVNSPTGQTPQWIFTVDSLTDADLRKDVPLGVSMMNNHI